MYLGISVKLDVYSVLIAATGELHGSVIELAFNSIANQHVYLNRLPTDR